MPADAGFFDSCLVKRLLETNKYPALTMMLKYLKEHRFQASDLSPTWNLMFLLRSYSRSEVIDKRGLIYYEAASKLAGTIPAAFTGQREHYELQVKEYRFIHENKQDRGFYEEIAALAIWDMRVLLSDIFVLESYSAGNGYVGLWKPPISNAGMVINLNYDFTFEGSLGYSGYEYLGRVQDDIPEKKQPLIIKPHGSLNWTSWNRWIHGRGWMYCGPWPSGKEEMSKDNLGYRMTTIPDIYSFHQQLIVTPEDYKETVVGNSTIPGLLDPILRTQWVKLEEYINKAKYLAFIGYSFPSGDGHLYFLLRKAFHASKNMEIHASCYKCEAESCGCSHCLCRTKGRIEELLGYQGDRICVHHIPRDSGDDRGIGHFLTGPDKCILNHKGG